MEPFPLIELFMRRRREGAINLGCVLYTGHTDMLLTTCIPLHDVVGEVDAHFVAISSDVRFGCTNEVIGVNEQGWLR